MQYVELRSSRESLANPSVVQAPQAEQGAVRSRKLVLLAQGKPIEILILSDGVAVPVFGPRPLVVLVDDVLLQAVLEQEARLGAKTFDDAMVGVSRDGVVENLIQALVTAANNTEKAHADAVRSIALALVVQALGRLREDADGLLRAGRQSPMPKWRLKRVVDHIDAHLDRTISLTEMARVAGLTRIYFAAQFRRTTGTSPHNFLLRRRVDKAKELLRESDMPLVEVGLTVGFGTQPHFTTVFKRLAGDTPHRWRQSEREQGPGLDARGVRPAADTNNIRLTAYQEACA